MYAIVRLRGGVNTRPDIKDTLGMLRLHRINHCVVVPKNPNYLGMIQKVKDFVAWGEIDEETLAFLLDKRGRVEKKGRLTDQVLRENSSYSTIKELASAVYAGSIKVGDLGIKPVFRLHPPRKGHRGLKKSVQEGGELGFHDSMESLIKKMR